VLEPIWTTSRKFLTIPALETRPLSSSPYALPIVFYSNDGDETCPGCDDKSKDLQTLNVTSRNKKRCYSHSSADILRGQAMN
jgi:hypothetical protein